jgi:hypothetical protein
VLALADVFELPPEVGLAPVVDVACPVVLADAVFSALLEPEPFPPPEPPVVPTTAQVPSCIVYTSPPLEFVTPTLAPPEERSQ